MRYRLRTLLILLALGPPLLSLAYLLTTGWFLRYVPEIDQYTVPLAGSASYQVNEDGTVDDR